MLNVKKAGNENKLLIGLAATVFSICLSQAVEVAYTSTQPGKITMTAGHTPSTCRQVTFKENSTGIVRNFRISDMGTAHDDVSSVVLAALIANRDVVVTYDPAITTGCGTEPAINWIGIY